MNCRTPTAVLALLLPCALSGCGTVGNCVSPCHGAKQEVYGGVAHSVKLGVASAEQAIDAASRYNAPGWALYTVGAAYCLAVDTPLSLVGDTLTLPLTLPPAWKQWRERNGWDASVTHLESAASWGNHEILPGQKQVTNLDIPKSEPAATDSVLP